MAKISHNTRLDSEIVLWNPSNCARKDLLQSSLQLDPSTGDHEYYFSGFVFDSKSKDYKVVRFLQSSFEVDSYYDHCIQQVKLYSYKRHSWKEISILDEDYVHYDISTYINGDYYWEAFGNDEAFVLSFNFVNEKFSRISLPKFFRRPFKYCLNLLEFNGLLTVFAYELKNLLNLGKKLRKKLHLFVLCGRLIEFIILQTFIGLVLMLPIMNKYMLVYHCLQLHTLL
ncbi:hypothetical protein PTKIN_Ptkin02bG0002500 [Pterospermum kingtungense]